MTPGDIVRIADGPLEIELLPAIGGRFHRIRAFGHDLLRTPEDVSRHLVDPVYWGGFVMAPWCNRLTTKPTPVGDRVVRVPATFGDGSAIHGQVLACPWEVVGPGRLRVVAGGDGWPWRYEAGLTVAIEGSTIQIVQTLTNLDAAPMPAGIGLHPWFTEPLEIRIPAGSVYRTNVDGDSDPEPVTGLYDLRRLGMMPRGLDATWTDLDTGSVELVWPGTGIHAELRARAFCASPEAVAARTEAAAGRICIVAANLGNGAIAIEPETHAPQGLRRLLAGEPDGLTMLEPGGVLRLSIELAVRLEPPDPSRV